ncbi:beta-ketoacyl synthase N-terminal-like domain-containing protein [Streptomyces sp. NPDC051555]|uniref:beta-ketoacyl synthase N-terminal-like domain-containing protein n=1 Tax=Streptomyces sp. NPDC051555 TaxID=3365657 RepID=UPI0037A48FCD
MEDREILTRFKSGTLERRRAVALLTGSPTAALATRPRRAAPAPPSAPRAPEPCAVIAFQGRFPGAVDLTAFWQLALAPGTTPAATPRADDPTTSATDATHTTATTATGRPAPRPTPPTNGTALAATGRVTATTATPRTTAPAVTAPHRPAPDAEGHFLDGVDAFDPDLFGIDPAAAARLDPQERLLLESARQVLESAGCHGARLDALGSPDGATASRGVGVYTAVTSHDYALLDPAGTPHGDPAGRLSRLLDLRGPSQSVDTGASSFLTALHHALAALRAGECAAALVGAAELHLHPGRLRPGDGEGVAAVLLKPLSAARADGDRVQAVILSSAVGHPGRGAHAPLRERLVQRALATARVPADTVTVTEDSRSAAPCVGRAGAATGAAALARAVLQLRHTTLLPAPAPAPTPVPADPGRAQPAPWPAGPPRRALVGVHEDGAPQAVLVLEEAPAPDPRHDPHQDPHPAPHPEPAGGPRLVLLSAPTPEHLGATAGQLARWLTDPTGAARGAVCDLDSVAGELRSGRAPMDCRLAVVAGDVPALASALAAFAAPPRAPGANATGPDHPHAPPVRSADLRAAGARDPLLLGDLDETRAYVDALWRGGRLEQLTRLWLAGVDVLTADRAPGARPVLDLPTTAARPRSFWFPAPPDDGRAERGDLG